LRIFFIDYAARLWIVTVQSRKTPMKKTTVKIPVCTHRRLQKHAKKVPFLKAPRLANDIITTELDRREGVK